MLCIGPQQRGRPPCPTSWTQVRPKRLSCGEPGILVKEGFLPSAPRRAFSSSNKQ